MRCDFWTNSARLCDAVAVGSRSADAMGGERAPAITRPPAVESLRELIRSGIPDAGMPAFGLDETELAQICRIFAHAGGSHAANHANWRSETGRSIFLRRPAIARSAT